MMSLGSLAYPAPKQLSFLCATLDFKLRIEGDLTQGRQIENEAGAESQPHWQAPALANH